MGEIAYYARLTATELGDLVQAPDRIKQLARNVGASKRPGDADPSNRRFLSVDNGVE